MSNERGNNLVESIASLQYNIDERDRFIGDLLILIVDRDLGRKCLEHEVPDLFGQAWNAVVLLIKENRELKEKLAQFSQGEEA